ncbi:MAG: LacI family DNA-binding transcriptional regulator [Chitinophagaceae bacterium]
MSNKTTLKHISDKLHLSVSTVSRALKGHPDISLETREKVKKIAEEMEYEPNTYAIGLRTNKSKLFGLIVPEISNFFYHSFISGLEEESRKIGYSLLILQSGNDPAVEAENIKLCRMNRVAGVFIALSGDSADATELQKLEEDEVPVIFFDKVPAMEACNKVRLADEDAAALAANHIIDKNKKYVLGIFGNPIMSITQKRKESFSNIISKHPSIQLNTAHAHSPEKAFDIIHDLIRENAKPDIVFTMSDEILIGVMKAVQVHKLNIPEDMGIISISNDGFIPRLYAPEITYIETSGYKLGKLAFERIKDHMEGKHFYRELILPSKLIAGKSL